MRRIVVAPTMLACGCALVSGLSQISVDSDGAAPMDGGGGDSTTTPDTSAPDTSTGDAGEGGRADFALEFATACANGLPSYSFSGSPFTAELWWKPGTPPISSEMKPLLYNGGRTASEPGWSLGVTNASLAFCVANGMTSTCATVQGGFQSIGHLLHIAAVSKIVVGARSLELWVLDYTMGQKNHTMIASASSAPVNWTATATFAVSGASINNGCVATLPGVVDDVRLWSEGLSAQQLDVAVFQSINCQIAALVADYAFDEGMGMTTTAACAVKGDLSINSATWLMSPFP